MTLRDRREQEVCFHLERSQIFACGYRKGLSSGLANHSVSLFIRLDGRHSEGSPCEEGKETTKRLEGFA